MSRPGRQITHIRLRALHQSTTQRLARSYCPCTRHRRLQGSPHSSSAEMFLVFDFDGTITTQDTIWELARSALQFQKEQRGLDLESKWDEVVQDYMIDYQSFKNDFIPREEERRSVNSELAFLRASKQVEEASLARVGASGVFHGLDTKTLSQMGADAVESGRITFRDGFKELAGLAQDRGWGLGVISVNWSTAFLQGALQNPEVQVIANEITRDGQIEGPTYLYDRLTSSSEKRTALDLLLPMHRGRAIYFGDSTTDLECVLHDGVVISVDHSSPLMRTLDRIGRSVPHVSEGRQLYGKISWARDFREVLESSLLEERKPLNRAR